jgi:hypothetical protein
MMHKTWNVRDQTEESLRLEAERLYKQIEAGYKMIKKISSSEEAKKIIDRIWIMKKWANDIELELLRREYTHEAQTANASTH